MGPGIYADAVGLIVCDRPGVLRIFSRGNPDIQYAIQWRQIGDPGPIGTELDIFLIRIAVKNAPRYQRNSVHINYLIIDMLRLDIECPFTATPDRFSCAVRIKPVDIHPVQSDHEIDIYQTGAGAGRF
jgi:hypothetical protein